MDATVEVLLVGEAAGSFLQLAHWLEERRCQCYFAFSCKEAFRLISCHRFDFVLSRLDLPDRSAYSLLTKLLGSSATLFFSTIVEDGCLWVPTLAHGRKWRAAKALRPNEFALTLGAALEEVHSLQNQTEHGAAQ